MNRPGYAADASIDRETGNVWAATIDISAVLMTLVSVTGFALIFFLLKRRSSGMPVFAIGIAVFALFYWKWVL